MLVSYDSSHFWTRPLSVGFKWILTSDLCLVWQTAQCSSRPAQNVCAPAVQRATSHLGKPSLCLCSSCLCFLVPACASVSLCRLVPLFHYAGMCLCFVWHFFLKTAKKTRSIYMCDLKNKISLDVKLHRTVFVNSCLHSAVNFTVIWEKCFIRITVIVILFIVSEAECLLKGFVLNLREGSTVKGVCLKRRFRCSCNK